VKARIEPPHDLEAETGVLGSIVLDGAAIALVADWLAVEDFYRENNGQIYLAALNLFRGGTPIDRTTLAAELEKLGVLERIGGRAHLALLESNCPTAANVEHYAEIVQDRAERRSEIAAERERDEGRLKELYDLRTAPVSANGHVAMRNVDLAPASLRVAFPVQVFPPAVQAYTTQLSGAGLQDFVGPSVLAVAAGAIGGCSVLRLGPTLSVRAILWVLLVGGNGDGKSEPMTDAAFPLIRHHAHLDEVYQRELVAYEAGERQAVPKHGGFWLDDLTIEGLREQLRGDPACFVLADEAHGFMKSLGQYKRTGGGDRDRWLTLWEGGSWRTRRVGGGVMVISKPTLTLLGAIQPSRLDVLGSGDDGARARFLIARGGPPTGARPHPTPEELAAYKAVLDQLVVSRQTQRDWVLDADAQARLAEVDVRFREVARSVGEADHVLEVARKANKLVARITHVLSELWRAEEAPDRVKSDGVVTAAMVTMAEGVLDYFLDQRRALEFPRPDLTAPLSVRDLDHGVRELREALRAHPDGRLTRRDVIRRRFGGTQSQDGADKLLDRFAAIYPGSVRDERPAVNRGPLTRVVYDPDRRPA
jgi:hypothetical protein